MISPIATMQLEVFANPLVSARRFYPYVVVLQADIAAALIRAGVAVHAFNQRSVAEILDMIRTLGAIVGADLRGPGDRLIKKRFHAPTQS